MINQKQINQQKTNQTEKIIQTSNSTNKKNITTSQKKLTQLKLKDNQVKENKEKKNLYNSYIQSQVSRYKKYRYIIKTIRRNIMSGYFIEKDFYYKKTVSDILNKVKTRLVSVYYELVMQNDVSEYIKSYNDYDQIIKKMTFLCDVYEKRFIFKPNLFKLTYEKYFLYENLFLKQRLIQKQISNFNSYNIYKSNKLMKRLEMESLNKSDSYSKFLNSEVCDNINNEYGNLNSSVIKLKTTTVNRRSTVKLNKDFLNTNPNQNLRSRQVNNEECHRKVEDYIDIDMSEEESMIGMNKILNEIENSCRLKLLSKLNKDILNRRSKEIYNQESNYHGDDYDVSLQYNQVSNNSNNKLYSKIFNHSKEKNERLNSNIFSITQFSNESNQMGQNISSQVNKSPNNLQIPYNTNLMNKEMIESNVILSKLNSIKYNYENNHHRSSDNKIKRFFSTQGFHSRLPFITQITPKAEKKNIKSSYNINIIQPDEENNLEPDSLSQKVETQSTNNNQLIVINDFNENTKSNQLVTERSLLNKTYKSNDDNSIINKGYNYNDIEFDSKISLNNAKSSIHKSSPINKNKVRMPMKISLKSKEKPEKSTSLIELEKKREKRKCLIKKFIKSNPIKYSNVELDESVTSRRSEIVKSITNLNQYVNDKRINKYKKKRELSTSLNKKVKSIIKRDNLKTGGFIYKHSNSVSSMRSDKEELVSYKDSNSNNLMMKSKKEIDYNQIYMNNNITTNSLGINQKHNEFKLFQNLKKSRVKDKPQPEMGKSQLFQKKIMKKTVKVNQSTGYIEEKNNNSSSFQMSSFGLYELPFMISLKGSLNRKFVKYDKSKLCSIRSKIVLKGSNEKKFFVTRLTKLN